MAFLSRIQSAVDTLYGRLALVFGVLVLAPTIVSIYLAWGSYLEHTERARLQVRQFATLTATYESKFFDDVRKILQRIGTEEPVRAGGGKGCNALISTTLDRTPEFSSLGFFDSAGRHICGKSDDLSNISNFAWLDDIKRIRGFVISNYTVTPASPLPVIIAAQAVHGTDGRFQGVLAASIRLYWLSAFIREISLPAESVFFLVDSHGNIIADQNAVRGPIYEKGRAEASTTPSAVSGLGSLSSILGATLAEGVLARSITDFEAVTSHDGMRRVFSSVALPHGDVTVLFGMPALTAIGWLEKDLLNRLLGLAAIWFAGIGAAWLGTRFLVTRWTSSLRHMARAYGRGNYSEKPSFANAPRELRDLGETLALMAHRIEVREAELRTSLEHKNIVLKEIHHRVKNNLQIVSSLLNIRGGSLSGAPEQSVIREVKTHVRALALVHRYLYESDDIRRVDLGVFMSELCRSAIAGLATPVQRVTLEIDIPEFPISIDRAVPIALLVTEAMTNSLKHAFPGGRRGKIRVAFVRHGPHSGVLTVSDDGIGLPPGAAGGTGIGLKLIESFANQLGGELEISGPPGTVVRVTVDDGSAATPPLEEAPGIGAAAKSDAA